MLTIKHCVYAISLAALFLIYPQNDVSAADKPNIFKSSEFLTWRRASQELYIDTTLGMAGLIMKQNDKAKGQCLDDWYLSDQAAAYDYVLGTMRKYPDFHPRGTIAAVIEKKCGSLIFN